MATVKEIVARLMEPIPLPRVATPKPQESWATLKSGDRLIQPMVNKQDDGAEEDCESPHTAWEVTTVTSAGVTLTLLDSDDGETVELTDRDWKLAGWQRQPRKRAKKGDLK